MREQHCIRSILGKPPFDQLPEERIFRLQSLPFLDGNRLCSADMLMTRTLPGRSIQFSALHIIGIVPAKHSAVAGQPWSRRMRATVRRAETAP